MKEENRVVCAKLIIATVFQVIFKSKTTKVAKHAKKKTDCSPFPFHVAQIRIYFLRLVLGVS
jgi:hypothetical protein